MPENEVLFDGVGTAPGGALGGAFASSAVASGVVAGGEAAALATTASAATAAAAVAAGGAAGTTAALTADGGATILVGGTGMVGELPHASISISISIFTGAACVDRSPIR